MKRAKQRRVERVRTYRDGVLLSPRWPYFDRPHRFWRRPCYPVTTMEWRGLGRFVPGTKVTLTLR